jgi:murein DD-endopeptidase MepM/ murein hydrolase activator NlpD
MFRGIVKTGIALGVLLSLLALLSPFLARLPSPLPSRIRPAAESRLPRPDAVPRAGTPPPLIVVDPADIERLRQRNLLFPVVHVDARTLRDSFEDLRGGGTRRHGALDILAPRGTPVLAVDDGSVARLHNSVGSGGLSVYHFDPTSTYCYYYAHLDRYAAGLKDGAPLKKGDVLGYVGTTGNAPPQTPHLHFGIFKLGPEKRWGHGVPINAFELWAPKRATG